MRWSLRKTINVKWKCMHSWITKTISTKLSLSLSLSELPLSFCKLDLVHLSTYIWGWSPMPDLFWDLQYLLRYKYYNKFEYVVFYRWGALLSSLTVNVHGYTLRSGVFQGMIMYKLIYYHLFRHMKSLRISRTQRLSLTKFYMTLRYHINRNTAISFGGKESTFPPKFTCKNTYITDVGKCAPPWTLKDERWWADDRPPMKATQQRR